MAVSDDRICVGMITGVHGVRGMVKLHSFTDPRDALGSYPVVDEAGLPLELDIVAPPNGHLLGQLKGLTDRNQAELLKGKRLYVNREALPPVADGEFYHADLIGIEARAVDGRLLGTVSNVHNYGAGDILEIGSGTAAFMVPFTNAFVPEVNVAQGTLVIAAFEETQ